MITAQDFEKATGRLPENNDLERANCPQAGELGHFHCGWNQERNLPRSQTAPFIKEL
jgi:hypothetical protein